MIFVDVVVDLLLVMGCWIDFIDVLYDVFVLGVVNLGVFKDVVWMFDYLFLMVFDGCNVYFINGV